jgi:hypothetical protein
VVGYVLEIMHMAFQANCPYSERKVTAFPLLSGDVLRGVLQSQGEVEVMHLTDDAHQGDLRWHLTGHERANLLKAIDLLGVAASG